MARNFDKKWEVESREDFLREAIALCDDVALKAWHTAASATNRCEAEKLKFRHDGALACRNAILEYLQAC